MHHPAALTVPDALGAGQAGVGLGPEIEIEYWVETKNKDRWNYLVGFNWSLSKRCSVHAEADAAGSWQGATASLTFRF